MQDLCYERKHSGLIPWNSHYWGQSNLVWQEEDGNNLNKVVKGFFAKWIERFSRYAVPLVEDIA